MRKWLAVLITLIVAVGFTAASYADDMGNKRKGKYTYRKVYKACHERGGVDSPKPPINPDAYTQSEWSRIFDGKEFGEFGCAEEWGQLGQEEIHDIYAYLHGHASDSPTPAKCK